MNHEATEAYVLAGIGVIGGVWKYYVKPELTANRAWLGLGALVMAYDLAAPDGETFSDGVDRGLNKHKLLTTGAIAITGAHLLNLIPEQIDPFSQFIKHVKGA